MRIPVRCINLIAGKTAKTGVSVKARLARGKYQRGVKASKRELQSSNVKPDDFHGKLNYTIAPKAFLRNCACQYFTVHYTDPREN